MEQTNKRVDIVDAKKILAAMENCPKFDALEYDSITNSNLKKLMYPKIVIMYKRGYDSEAIHHFLVAKNSPVILTVDEINQIIKEYNSRKKKSKANALKTKSETIADTTSDHSVNSTDKKEEI